MTVTHRTTDGAWAACVTPACCELLFHFPDTTPEMMALLPEAMVWALCDIIDPPTDVYQSPTGEHRMWKQAGRLHRAYDLPALTRTNEWVWMVDGRQHRDHDRPAVVRIFDDGREMRSWMVEGRQHRAGGQPAFTISDGSRCDYWVDGVQELPSVT